MKRKSSISLAAALMLIAGQIHGQTPDTKADLVLLEMRAATDAEMSAIFSQLRGETGVRSGRTVEQMVDMFSGLRQSRKGTLPVNYRLQAQLRGAAIRAQAVSEILRSDLNGDWQITRNELVASLGQADHGGSQAATAFVLGDMDQNGALSTDEIKAAAEAMLDSTSRHQGSESTVRLFDLDDDGILTKSEYDRVVAALKS